MQYLIIAGPQAAGKTTTKDHLERRYNGYNSKNVFFLQETRDILNKRYNPFGTLTSTRDLEYKIIEEDLKRLNVIEETEKDKDIMYIDETSLFTLAHSTLYNIETKNYFNEYINVLKKLNSKIIFLDVTPDISWSRRKERYKERVENMDENEKRDAMRRYRIYLDYAYPELLKIFGKINLPKIKIYNG